MRMKGFQSLGVIWDHYREIIREYDKNNKYGQMTLETWNIYPEDKDDILDEKMAIEYLVYCQYGFAKGMDLYKPPKRILIRLFTRHLNFIESIYINGIDNPIAKKEHETCKIYLERINDDNWYNSLPSIIHEIKGEF